jgi:hypothetical protein
VQLPYRALPTPALADTVRRQGHLRSTPRPHAQCPSAALFDISGVGDNAFGQAEGTRAAINFGKGDALLVIGLDLAGATEPPRDQIKALAVSAAART